MYVFILNRNMGQCIIIAMSSLPENDISMGPESLVSVKQQFNYV